MVQKLQLPIIKRKEIAKGTVEISFGLENNEFSFKAGQYMHVTIPKLIFQDNKGSSRDFSIASSPNDKKSLKTVFRVSDSSFKQTLTKMPIGSKVDVNGPMGVFTLPDKIDKPIVLIAGGIGITPFMSMIKYATENKLDNKLMLIYTNKSPERAAYLKELEELQRQNPNFKLISRFKRIDHDFIKENIKNVKDCLWYVCGTPGMVIGVREMLMKIGISESDIFFEEFSGY